MALALLERQHNSRETWLQDYVDNFSDLGRKVDVDALRDAYHFGKRFSQNVQGPYEAVEMQIMEVWDDLIGPDSLIWEDAQPVIEYAYNYGSEA